MSFRVLTLSLISAAGLFLAGCGGAAPPASIPAKPAERVGDKPTVDPAAEPDTAEAVLQANTSIDPEIKAEVQASIDPEVLQEAARHLEGVWTGVVELNQEAVKEQKLPADIVEKMKSMTITLDFRPNAVAKMTATTQTDEGPVTETVDAAWQVTAALGQEVVIGWQEPNSRAELHQLKFENNNVFTRPPPGGSERNRDLGQIRFTRVQVSQKQ